VEKSLSQKYDPREIELRRQKLWLESRPYRALNPGDPGFDPSRPKYYVLDMFPYPSGSGLHVGHPVGYIGSDIVARRKRMEGFNVLHPMGWDAFGLPAEQFAIKTGKHPSETTRENSDAFRRQLRLIGLSFDWEREINTSHVDYYRWTQWLFARLYDRGLVYRTEVPVWWCEDLKTVLANEEVINGRSERGNHPCVRRPLKQWMLRITAYADRLLDDLEQLDWPESIKQMQREWIGRSEGAEIDFAVEGVEDDKLVVFTTRPDTLFGATFMVVAPEHQMVRRITTEERRAEVEPYVAAAAAKSDLERTDLSKQKSGVFTGSYALNPLLQPDDPAARIPIWVADYVLYSYGTGAIMAVPGHDERDFEFANRYGLEVKEVVRPPDGTPGLSDGHCFTGEGTSVNSGQIDGLPTAEAFKRTIDLLEQRSAGRAKTSYRLRDWLFSRQRYWGEPFPLLHLEDGSVKRVPDDELPVELPEMTDFTPSADGSPPLARATDWVETVDSETGKPARRDTDTMPGWAGSCWYYLRFTDPHWSERPFREEVERYWSPVDLYVGGASHAVMHLLYARFWHKVFHDIGIVSNPEPFQKLFNQGMLTATAYQDDTGRQVPSREVEETGDGRTVHRETGEEVKPYIAAMSKSLGNVINPDDVIAEHGADAFRLYEMFMAPLGDTRTWDTRGISGCRRFLDRVWKVYVDPDSDAWIRPELRDIRTTAPNGPAPASRSEELERALNQMLKRVDDSFELLNFNTAIAAMMTFINEVLKRPDELSRDQAERFLLALAPFAPHLAEELWERLGHGPSIARAPWPEVDEAYLEEEKFELVVQVMGKVRGKAEAPRSASKEQLEELARATAEKQLAGREVVKVIVVPGRLVNFVVR
jgi:leucyl-tRNA synthetase